MQTTTKNVIDQLKACAALAREAQAAGDSGRYQRLVEEFLYGSHGEGEALELPLLRKKKTPRRAASSDVAHKLV